MVTPKVTPGTPVPQDGVPTASALQTSDHLVAVARAIAEKPVDGKEANTQAAARAEHELERIEHQIGQLENAAGDNQEARRQLEQLHAQVHALRRQMDAHLHSWHKAELARHPQRPYTLDYVERIFTDWSEIHGDRGFADDPAIVSGMARFHGEEVMVVGHQKGRDTKQKLYRNFGMPNPEGYRKALRLMRHAGRLGMPVITLVDTPGAFPGLGAEERGQAVAIAESIMEMARLPVPIVTVVTGEGGSGGALALAVGDRVLMLENAYYSVISPEGCSVILWSNAASAPRAAEALRVRAPDLLELRIVDGVVPEPEDGAHTDQVTTAANLKEALVTTLNELMPIDPQTLLAARYQRFRCFGTPAAHAAPALAGASAKEDDR
jgi:acetyl-CoA carboxylase carboxyl transferase subunit alpha